MNVDAQDCIVDGATLRVLSRNEVHYFELLRTKDSNPLKLRNAWHGEAITSEVFKQVGVQLLLPTFRPAITSEVSCRQARMAAQIPSLDIQLPAFRYRVPSTAATTVHRE